MTDELRKIISDLGALFSDWTSRKIPTEEEFLTGLKPLAAKLSEEIKKPQPEQKVIDPEKKGGEGEE